MSHFAKISPTNKPNIFMVVDVLVAEEDVINSGLFGDPASWVQTSYNTYGGVHYAPTNDPTVRAFSKPDGGRALRANYACIGGTYDSEADVFYGPRPKDINDVICSSWTISAPNWLWKPPTPQPRFAPHYWDETTLSWFPLASSKSK
jgi:hypothetical protein